MFTFLDYPSPCKTSLKCWRQRHLVYFFLQNNLQPRHQVLSVFLSFFNMAAVLSLRYPASVNHCNGLQFNMASDKKKMLVEKLFDIQAIKFGDFTLKSGIQSPVYVDLRVIVSYPEIMREISDLLWKTASDSKADFSVICGVPYTALPIASCMSVDQNVPMVMRRKEAKSYGTKRLIEGVFAAGSKCLVVEDVVTSGSSVMETVEALASVDLRVSDAVVLLDRFQGGKDPSSYQETRCLKKFVGNISDHFCKLETVCLKKVSTSSLSFE